MTDANAVRPDITLTIDFDGVIREAVSSETLADEKLEAWRGRPWPDTVDPAISQQIVQMIDDVRRRGASSYFQIRQQFPSGRELPMEYLTISLGEPAGFIAIGKNLQMISDLQSRLLVAQQARERDYWKIREIETRYHLLFDATSEAVFLARVADLRIVEANLAATKSLGFLIGSEFCLDLQPRDRKSFVDLLEKVREHGRAPGIVLHLGSSNTLWSLRASLMTNESGAFYLFQMSAIGASVEGKTKRGALSIEDLIQRNPDGFVVVDSDGIVRGANHGFLDLAQVGAEGVVVGQNLNRWLSRPGADLMVVLNLVQRHGSVRLLQTTMSGDLGATTQVEISGAGNKDGNPDYIGLLIRDVTTRLHDGTTNEPPSWAFEPTHGYLGDVSLEKVVKASTESIERQRIEAALTEARGNRTVAAKLLGLSRQSLHTKIKKYELSANKK